MTEQNRQHHHFNIPGHRSGHTEDEVRAILDEALLDASFTEPETDTVEEQPLAKIIEFGDRLSIVRNAETGKPKAA